MDEVGREVTVREEDGGLEQTACESLGEMCRSSCTRGWPLHATTNAFYKHREEPAQLFPDAQFPEFSFRQTSLIHLSLVRLGLECHSSADRV